MPLVGLRQDVVSDDGLADVARRWGDAHGVIEDGLLVIGQRRLAHVQGVSVLAGEGGGGAL